MSFALRRKPKSPHSSRRSRWHLLLGTRGERAAARHLRRRGYTVLARNYRCPSGEIDLICALRECIVFVEVKTRVGEGSPTSAKAQDSQWQRIARSARFFLARYGATHRPYRFDLVSIGWARRGKPVIVHTQNAFAPRWV